MLRLSRFCLAISCVVPTAAYGAVVLDQEFTASDSVSYSLDYPGDFIAQTFTVEHSGLLATIGVQLTQSGSGFNPKPAIDDMHVQIVRTDSSGAPAIDQVLGSYTIANDVVPKGFQSPTQFINHDVLDLDLYVHTGDVLAIVLSSGQTFWDDHNKELNNFNYTWSTAEDLHPGGDFYIFSPKLYGPVPYRYLGQPEDPSTARDMGFRVLISTPEPATRVLVLIALVAASIASSRRRVA